MRREGLLTDLPRGFAIVFLCLAGCIIPTQATSQNILALHDASIDLIAPANQQLFHPASEGLRFKVSAIGVTNLAALSVALFLNGRDVSSELAVTQESDHLLVKYLKLETDQQYEALAQVRNATNTLAFIQWSFDTYGSPSTVLIEAEHYNFGGGKFISLPELSYIESSSNYFNKVAIEGIDARQTSTSGSHFYRPSDRVGLEVATDRVRPVYSNLQVDDYQVSAMEPGEWLNYTRSVTPGTYQVFARLTGSSSALVWAALDQVVSGSASTVQSLSASGLFKRPPNAQSHEYSYVPLTDALGEPMTLRLSGQTTFRLTSNDKELTCNFLILVPVALSEPIPPALVALTPIPNETGVMPDTVILAKFKQGDEHVDVTRLRLYVNSEDVTESSFMQTIPAEITLSYRPVDFFPLDSTNTVRLVTQNTNESAVTNEWSFVVIDSIAALPANLAFPSAAGRQRGFTAHFVEPALPAAPSNFLDQADAVLAGSHGPSGDSIPVIAQSLVAIQTANLTVQQDDIDAGIQRGLFSGDILLPGLIQPATNVAMELIAFLALERGSHRFGIYCNDACRLSAGHNPFVTNVVLFQCNTSREAGEIQFDFLAEATGIYGFRLVWKHEGNDGSLEWYSIDRNTGIRTLINDTTKPNPILAYRQMAANFPPIMMMQEPTNLTVVAGQEAVFTIAITNREPGNALLQWQVNGNDVPNAHSDRFVIPSAELADDGKRIRCAVMVPGFFTQTTAEALLRVQSGSSPYVTQAACNRWLNTVTVSFSESMEFVTAQDPNRYRFDGGLAVFGAVLDMSGSNVVLFTGQQAPGQTYTLQVQDVLSSGGAATASNTTASAIAYGLQPGLALRQVYYGIEGTSVLDLEQAEGFSLERCDASESIGTLETSQNIADNYGQRLAGYIVPPVTGDYQFFIAASDQASLRLSMGEDVNTKTTIASVTSPCGYRQWTASTTQISAPFRLQAGTHYFFEVLHKAGVGPDHLEVAWIIPGQPEQTNIIGSPFLIVPANPAQASIRILQEPEDVSVSEGQPATFSVLAEGHSEFSTNLVYQWQRNRLDLPSAQQPVFCVNAAGPADDKAKFRCVISVPGKTVASVEATLNVASQSAARLRFEHGLQSLTLAWDTPPVSPDYQVERTTNFAAGWFPVGVSPVSSHGTSRVALPIAEKCGFFRLHR